MYLCNVVNNINQNHLTISKKTDYNILIMNWEICSAIMEYWKLMSCESQAMQKLTKSIEKEACQKPLRNTFTIVISWYANNSVNQAAVFTAEMRCERALQKVWYQTVINSIQKSTLSKMADFHDFPDSFDFNWGSSMAQQYIRKWAAFCQLPSPCWFYAAAQRDWWLEKSLESEIPGGDNSLWHWDIAALLIVCGVKLDTSDI